MNVIILGLAHLFSWSTPLSYSMAKVDTIYPVWVECSPMGRETGVRSQVDSYQRQNKKKNMVLDASLLNTQHYKGMDQGGNGAIQGME